MLPTDIVSFVPKSVVLVSYGIGATALCLLPVVAAAADLGRRVAWLPARPGRAILGALFVALFLGCVWFGHGGDSINIAVLTLVAALLLCFVNGRFDRLVFAATFTTLFVTRMLIWWRQSIGPLYFSDWEIAQIALLLLFVMAVLNEFGPFRARPIKDYHSNMLTRGVVALILFAIAAAMSFASQVEARPANAYSTWHHWSVYIAPVELLRAGAVPLKDFAVQYGLGPTFLIDMLAKSDPWRVMPALTSLMLLLQTVLVGGIVWVIVDVRRSTLYFALALLACSGACMTWIAWPPELAVAAQAASVSGMRYTPILVLTFFIVLFGARIEQRRYAFAGHLIWILVSLWAPELLFYATAVWGPYYLWQKATATGRFELISAIKAVLLLGLLLAITSCAFLALFWMRFNTLPSWYGYIAYVVNEPDPLNLAVRGVVWTLVTLLILIGIALFEALRLRPRDAATRNLFVTLCLWLATLSIFVGRSHENNFLVVLPFCLLTVLSAAISSQQIWLKRALYAFLACSLAYWPIFNWGPWLDFVHAAHDKGVAAVFDSKPLTTELSYMTPEGQGVLLEHRPERLAKSVNPADAERAISDITSQYGEPIMVYDINFVMLTGPESRGWNAIQDPAAFLPLSANKRLGFIAATAQRLNQPGWIVVNRLWLTNWSRSRGLLDDMDSAYVEDKQLDFGSYYAIRFVPKAAAKPQSQAGLPHSK